MPCEKIDFILNGNETKALNLYPGCDTFYDGTNLDQVVAVLANVHNMQQDPVQTAAAVNMMAPLAGWLALLTHAVGIEIYVSVCTNLMLVAETDIKL